MRARRAVFAALLAVSATGCKWSVTDAISPGVWDCCGWGPGSGPFDLPFGALFAHNMLTGDTMRVAAFSTTSDATSTWAISGPAVFVVGDSVATRVTKPTLEVLVRSTGAGEVTLKIVRADGRDSASTTFLVADPSEVTLRIVQGKHLRIRVGESSYSITAHLLDAQGRHYRGSLFWASTDTATVALADAYYPTPFEKRVLGRAVGVTNVEVSFRHQRDTARVEVEP